MTHDRYVLVHIAEGVFAPVGYDTIAGILGVDEGRIAEAIERRAASAVERIAAEEAREAATGNEA